MPKRIQRQRTKGWRMPEGAVYVGRPSKWGNPYGEGYVVFYRKFGIVEQFTIASPREAVALYRRWLDRDPLVPRSGRNVHKAPPSVADIRSVLAGRGLVCWCPLDDGSDAARVPCHANVLLEIANGMSDEDRCANAEDSRFVDTEDARGRYQEEVTT